MKLWLVERTDAVGYECYDSVVVAADTEHEAALTRPNDFGWTSREHLKVKMIGSAADGVERGVVLASYNAG